MPASIRRTQPVNAWALFGIAIFVALASGLLHAVLRRNSRLPFVLSLLALLCLAGTQVIFWGFTYPINVASANWTVMPEAFEAARRQWEYSHAASAVLSFLALLVIAASVVADAQLPTGAPRSVHAR